MASAPAGAAQRIGVVDEQAGSDAEQPDVLAHPEYLRHYNTVRPHRALTCDRPLRSVPSLPWDVQPQRQRWNASMCSAA
ncbi:hypothetical protein Vau01_108110 [Virgisporangium aurantiacum]|uniref:Uncharacterized protein n=1 Tax=Virgisporangium aurantiacum TaxID=175570 RepID=A0A8J4E5Q4_9ACTN|nr:hypothetical protein Vau01_108110 [Virgisporangium aurantiacum]